MPTDTADRTPMPPPGPPSAPVATAPEALRSFLERVGAHPRADAPTGPIRLVEIGAGRAGTGRVFEARSPDGSRTVLKWADASPHHRERARREIDVLGAFTTEQEERALAVRVPSLLGWSEAVDRRWLLLALESLPGLAGDAVQGCDAATVIETARTIARVHAAFAGPRLGCLADLDLPHWGVGAGRPSERPHRRRAERFAKRVGRLDGAVAGTFELPVALRGRVAELTARDPAGRRGLERHLEVLAEAPRTVIHGDLHLDNLVFDHRGVGVLDWQSTSVGSGIVDLIRFATESHPDPDVLAEAAAAWREARLDAGDDPDRVERELAAAPAAFDAMLAGVVSGFSANAAARLGERGRQWFRRLLGPRGLVRLIESDVFDRAPFRTRA